MRYRVREVKELGHGYAAGGGEVGFELEPGRCHSDHTHPAFQLPDGQQASSRPALVVRPGGLAPGGGHQQCGGLLHHALRPALWTGQLPQVAHLHCRLLRGERVCHPAPEGQAALDPSVHTFPPASCPVLRLSRSFVYSLQTYTAPCR